MSAATLVSRGIRKQTSARTNSPTPSPERFTFSGHETFQCRSLWLKKGYDFLRSGGKFSQPDAVVRLGVGKNMVSSIRFWMSAFGFSNENDELAKFLFGPRGKDPYLERPGSLWLLHHQLITRGVASTFSLVFNEFRRERPEFTKEQLLNFLKRKCQEQREPFNEHIIERDIGVFLKTYLRLNMKVKNIEEEFAGIFLELNLIEELEPLDEAGKRYRIASRERHDIPFEVVLFCILSNDKYGRSISFHDLLNDKNSVGSVFALNGDGLIHKIDEMTKTYKGITYQESSGIREVQFKEKLSPWDVLKRFYAN